MLPPNNSLCPCGNMCTLGNGVCFLPSVPGRGVLDQQNAVEVTWTSPGLKATFALPFGTQLLSKEAQARELKNVERKKGGPIPVTTSDAHE